MHKLPRIELPCGGIAYFDETSGISYRCEVCGAVVGSIGQPRECKEEADKYELIKQLGGKGWEAHEHIVEENEN
jgi:hypothetical protein